MNIENQIMLSAMEASGDIRYLYDCIDITLAGEDWKVQKIRYLTADQSHPLRDYVCFGWYGIGAESSLLVGIHTKEDALTEQAVKLLFTDEAAEKEIRTEFPEVLKHPTLTKRFSMVDANEFVSPIYALADKTKLQPYKPVSGVTVSLWNGENRESVRSELKGMGDDIDYICPCFRDTRRYLLCLNGRTVGYLRAECAWKNVYDVGWLYIEPDFRGRGLGRQLVLAFAHDCLNRGDVPHYGFAINPESSRVAENCGFENVRPATRAVILYQIGAS